MAAATYPVWPSALPQAGRWNVTGGPQMNVVSFEPEVGQTINRRRSSSIVRSYSIELPPMNATQYEAWQTWFHDTLGDGVNSFIWVNPLTREFSICKFQQGGQRGYEESLTTNELITVRFTLAVLRKVSNTAYDALFGEVGIWVDFINDKVAIINDDGTAEIGRILDFFTFTRATTATYVGSDGLIKTAAVGALRFDHDPVTGDALGVLFEGARTNLATKSQEFDHSDWSKTRSSVTVDAAVAPDGTTTADKLVEDSTAGNTHTLSRSFTPTTGDLVTWSIWLKAAERTWAAVQIGNFANQVASNVITINLATGAFTATDVARSRVEAYPNGWYRVSTTVTSSNGGALAPSVLLHDGTSTSYDGDGASGIYTWGAQYEVGGFPSSYIPTTTASATRNIDSLIMLTERISMPAVTTLTLFAEYYATSLAKSGAASNELFLTPLSLDANSLNTIFAFRLNTDNALAFTGSEATFDGVAVTSGTPDTSGGLTKFAAALGTANDLAAVRNGGTVVSDSSLTTPAVASFTHFRIGSQSGATRSIFGPVRTAALFSRRMTNSEIQTRTALAA